MERRACSEGSLFFRPVEGNNHDSSLLQFMSRCLLLLLLQNWCWRFREGGLMA